MPQDALPEARRILGGAFYGNSLLHFSNFTVFTVECARGHPYFIGEVSDHIQCVRLWH